MAVTGGAGFIGSHVVERILRERPRRVDVIDNLWLGRRENLAEARDRGDVRLHVIDATNATAVRGVIRAARTDVVFALATIPLPASLTRPRWSMDRIVRLTQVCVELARAGEYGALVHCSSSEVYGSAVRVPMDERHPLDPTTPYAAAKAACDLIVAAYQRTYDIDATIVRPFNTYGPRQNRADWAGIIPLTLERIARGEAPIIHGDGKQTRDLTYVTDVAEAIVRAFLAPEARGMVLNIASGREVRIEDLTRRLLRLTGSDLRPVRAEARPGDVRRHRGDASLARRVLGAGPRIGLDEGLRRTVAWYDRERRRRR